MAEGHNRKPEAFRGYDESLALRYAETAINSMSPEDIALDLGEPDGHWRLRRAVHGIVRDEGEVEGLSLYESLALQGGARRLVSDTRFVAHILEQKEQQSER